MYKKIRKLLVENKYEIKLGFWAAVIFFAGFGAGLKHEAKNRGLFLQTYSSQYQGLPSLSKTSPADPTCPIKGNISKDGKKTYHVPGGDLYKKTTAEECFKTEVEAKDAGFVRSGR